jgi:asparagine synthase (glutamine-hydrolysing)
VSLVAGLHALDGALPDAGLVARLAAALVGRGRGTDGRHDGGAVVLLRRGPDGGGPFTASGGTALVGDGALDPAPLQLYAAYGIEFARHLRGGTALALHDPAADRLLLARDGFGIKPLYYAETAVGFVFASTAALLLAAGVVPAELVASQRNELLQLQFTTGRLTPFAGIYRVLPGETLIVERGRLVDRRLVRALPAAPPMPAAVEPALATLDVLLDRSLARQGDGAGPTGLFLSGGVDSAVLLAVMARRDMAPVQALALGFSQAAGDG